MVKAVARVGPQEGLAPKLSRPHAIISGENRPRLLAVASHPIQYFAPVYRALHRRGRVALRVVYCRPFGVVPSYDKQFGASVQWDGDLLTGYESRFLRNWSPITDTFRPLHALNPGVVREIARGTEAVWVNGFWYPTNLMAIATAQALRIPVLFRSELRRARFIAPGGAVRAAAYRTMLRWVDKALYIGAESKCAYEWLGMGAERLTFCPYTVEMDRFAVTDGERSQKRQAVRARLGIGAHDRVIVFGGKLTGRKRPADLLALDYFEEARGVVLLWVGLGEMEEEIRRASHRLTRCRGILVGFVNQSELPDYLWASDVFVFPAVNEPWGLILNEAMAAGLPAVVSDDVGAATDLCLDGVTGFRFPAGNTQQMAARVLEIFGNEQLRHRMGEAARRLIAEWTPEATAEGIETAVLQVTSEPS